MKASLTCSGASLLVIFEAATELLYLTLLFHAILGGAAWCWLLGDLAEHLKVNVWDLLEDPRAEAALRRLALSACSVLAPFFCRLPGFLVHLRGEVVTAEETLDRIEVEQEDSDLSFDTLESADLSDDSEETERISLSEWYQEDTSFPELFSISDDPDEDDSVAGGPAGLV